MENKEKIIQTFLHYGYLPDPNVQLPYSLKLWMNGELEKVDFTAYKESDLIKIGGDILKDVIKEEIGNDHNKTHIVPLSGGYDSRAILAGLLEYLDSSQIIAVTFGVPKSFDFEIAKNVAKIAGVQWECIDLSPGNWFWNNDNLINTAKESCKPNWIFDTYVNYEIPKRYGHDCIYWSGFMGDPLSGSHIAKGIISSWDEAKKIFAKKNNRSRMTMQYFDATNVLPEYPYTNNSRLSYYEQLDFCIRQMCLSLPIVRHPKYNYKYPFLNYKWVQYILSLHNRYRKNQWIYKCILRNNWDNYFQNNTKYVSIQLIIEKLINKLSINYRPNKNSNYIDWNYALRYQDDFKDLVYSNLRDFNDRKIIEWFDIDDLWKKHQSGKKNVSNEILTVAALELHLKAGDCYIVS